MTSLLRVIPVSALERILAATGRGALRVRTFPPWVCAYHVLASAAWPQATYTQVTGLLWGTLPAMTGRRLAQHFPSPGAVTRARARLGAEPFQRLFADLIAMPAPASPFLGEVELVQVTVPAGHRSPGWTLWSLTDATTGRLRGLSVDGANIEAAVALIESSGARRVGVQPGLTSSHREHLTVRLAGVAEVGEPSPGGWSKESAASWSRLRARTPQALQQALWAHACVQVAADIAVAEERSKHTR